MDEGVDGGMGGGCLSVAAVCVRKFNPAVLTSRRVVMIGRLNRRPRHGQSQFVCVIFRNMLGGVSSFLFGFEGGYPLGILMWIEWFIQHFRTACSLRERRGFMVGEMTALKLERLFSLIEHFYVNCASLDRTQRGRGEGRTGARRADSSGFCASAR